MNKALHKLAQTQTQEFWFMKDIPEVICGTALRSGSNKLDNLAAYGTVSKLSWGEYRVGLSYQYALGEKQIIAGKAKFKSLKAAMKFMNNAVRFYYGRAVSRKIASILIDGIDTEIIEEVLS